MRCVTSTASRDPGPRPLTPGPPCWSKRTPRPFETASMGSRHSTFRCASRRARETRGICSVQHACGRPPHRRGWGPAVTSRHAHRRWSGSPKPSVSAVWEAGRSTCEPGRSAGASRSTTSSAAIRRMDRRTSMTPWPTTTTTASRNCEMRSNVPSPKDARTVCTCAPDMVTTAFATWTLAAT